jgi:hypothetical protein
MMRIAGGWVRIYLFYGLIFFLLGLAGSLLESGWAEEPRLGRGLNILFANLGKYMNPVIPGNNTMMVLAGRNRLSIRLLYPVGIPGKRVAMPDKIRRLLGETYYPVDVERFKSSGDYQRLWSRCSNVGADQIGVGLNIIPVVNRKDRYRVQLGLAFPIQLREAMMQQMENVFKEIPSYSLRQIRRGYLCRQDYHWEQSGDLESVLTAFSNALAAIPALWRPGI